MFWQLLRSARGTTAQLGYTEVCRGLQGPDEVCRGLLGSVEVCWALLKSPGSLHGSAGVFRGLQGLVGHC